VVKYVYDAYGNILQIIGNQIIGKKNPFRYKGYYYDDETQLYWVSSRYYSPELCRWISPDSIEYLDPESINGLNLYAYCNNDPVNKYDPTGHIAISLIVGTLLAFGIGFAGSAVSQYFQYNGEIDWIQAGIDGLFAAGSAILAYTGINLGLSIIAGATMGMGQYALDSAYFHDDFSWSGLITAGILGAAGGAVSGRGAQHFKSIGSNLDETGRTGVKAILTAYDRYGTGLGYQKVLNLWGGRVANSLATSISQNFTRSVIKIWIATGVTYGLSYGIGKGLKKWGLNF
jgi:RHS repeat-associated protein